MSGELAIMAMTGRDEVLTKNPDALLNGEAVTSVIKSCVPGIGDPKNIPITDIDTLLIAIKIASSGDEHEITAKCPSCKTENRVNINMRNLLATAKMLETEYVVTLDTGIKVYIKPYTYTMQTEAALAAFDETKAIQQLSKENANNISADAMSVYNKSFNKMADISVSLLARSIVKVVTPDGEEETHANEIFAFLQNIDSTAAKAIDSKLAEINALDIDKKVSLVCQNEKCKKEWETTLDINPTDFFVAGS